MEVWNKIYGYEGLYEVSNLGNVKALHRNRTTGTGNYERKARILSQFVTKAGYKTVVLYNQDSKRRNYFVHQLIAIAFLNHTPNGMKMVVDHIDGNKLNNSATNLRVVTQRGNLLDGYNKRRSSSNYTSRFNGVCWSKKSNKWMSYATVCGKRVYLGVHNNEEYAASISRNYILAHQNEEDN